MANEKSRGNAAKPISLAPLTLDEAVEVLLSVDPDDLEEAPTSPEQTDPPKSAAGN